VVIRGLGDVELKYGTQQAVEQNAEFECCIPKHYFCREIIPLIGCNDLLSQLLLQLIVVRELGGRILGHPSACKKYQMKT
jgi:hypothetical protein